MTTRDEDKIIAQQARIEQLTNFIKYAQVSSGVCCCGDSMEGHPSPMTCGHSPVDMWDYHSGELLEAYPDDLSALRAHDEKLRRAAFKAGAASRDAEVVSLTNQRDYEYVRAENAEQERDQFEQERDQLRTELVKALAACKAKDEAILRENYSLALSIQPDDSALKAWLGKPVAWEYADAFGTHYTDDRREWIDTPGIESVTCLYSPKGLK